MSAARRSALIALGSATSLASHPRITRPIISSPFFTSSLRKMSSGQADHGPQEVVFTKDAPFPAGPYSQAIKTPFAIFCSGQIPVDAEGNLLEGTIQEKTAAVIKAHSAVLKAAGSSLEKVVKVNIFLADMADFAGMNEEYAKWYAHKPARSCVAVKTLPKGVTVEIECIALP